MSKSTSPFNSLAIPGLEPMEAKLVDDLPDEAGWQFEPKWDGFRCLAFRTGDDVDLRAKSGKPLARYFPEVVAPSQLVTPQFPTHLNREFSRADRECFRESRVAKSPADRIFGKDRYARHGFSTSLQS